MLQRHEPHLHIGPIARVRTLRNQAYDTIKRLILEMDSHTGSAGIRLKEHQLAQDLGISRQPVREALTLLEQEGLVHTVPGRGVMVVRKSKRELIETITVLAALMGMAARCTARHASDAELASLGNTSHTSMRATPLGQSPDDTHGSLAFHRALARLGGCCLLDEMTARLSLHLRATWAASAHGSSRAEHSLREQAGIVAALQARDAERAAILARDHVLGLAAHVDTLWTMPDP